MIKVEVDSKKLGNREMVNALVDEILARCCASLI